MAAGFAAVAGFFRLDVQGVGTAGFAAVVQLFAVQGDVTGKELPALVELGKAVIVELLSRLDAPLVVKAAAA